MPIDAARAFDKDRNFDVFWAAEPVGAARWIAAVMRAAEARAESLEGLQDAIKGQLTGAALAALEAAIKGAGAVLSKSVQEFKPDDLRALGWKWNETMCPLMVRGVLRVEPTTSDLRKRLVILVGQTTHPLICNDDPLESFAGDLSAFEGCYEIALVGWPDASGQFFVEEAAPIMIAGQTAWNDWAQGRLFDNGVAGGPVVLRVNKNRQVQIGDTAAQEALRPFVGTAVVLYGRRVINGDKVSIESVKSDIWVLTRLTNPADAGAGLPAAPRPVLQLGGAMCIGATPPWNWQGPNVLTHLLCPSYAANLSDTEERRLVFGRPLPDLPGGWGNPIDEVHRVVQVHTVADRAIDSAAHWGTRRAPKGPLLKSIAGVALMTSAEQSFSA